MNNFNLQSLSEFIEKFPEDYLIKPTGKIPADSHMVYSLKKAVLTWEPDNFCGYDLFRETDLNLERENRIVKGPKAGGGQRYHGYDVFGTVLSRPHSVLRDNYAESREIRSFIREPINKLSKNLLQESNRPLWEASDVFSKIVKFLLLTSEDKKRFPIYDVINEILLSGGLPVGWKGEFIEASCSPNNRNELPKGSFIVYWPYEKDPEFSDTICCTA